MKYLICKDFFICKIKTLYTPVSSIVIVVIKTDLVAGFVWLQVLLVKNFTAKFGFFTSDTVRLKTIETVSSSLESIFNLAMFCELTALLNNFRFRFCFIMFGSDEQDVEFVDEKKFVNFKLFFVKKRENIENVDERIDEGRPESRDSLRFIFVN